MSAPQLLDLAILTLVWAGIAAAWNLLAGFAGQFSLGHAAFFGIGAYSAAIPAVRYGITPWGGMLVGVLLAGLLALLIPRAVCACVGRSSPCSRSRSQKWCALSPCTRNA